MNLGRLIKFTFQTYLNEILHLIQSLIFRINSLNNAISPTIKDKMAIIFSQLSNLTQSK